MDIQAIIEALGSKSAIEAFTKANLAKAEFYEEAKKQLGALAPVIVSLVEAGVKNAEVDARRREKNLKWNEYEFRYGKKYTTSAIFRRSNDIKIGPRDEITFLGRKADNPENLEFKVKPYVPEGADPAPAAEDIIVSVKEELVLTWLINGMIH